MQNQNQHESLMYITNRPDTIFVKGEGMWLYDQDGEKYLDFVQGWAVNCLGHSNAQMVETISKQAQLLINSSPSFYNLPMIELADLITQNCALDKVFFTNTGAEANEGAIKLARKWGQKHKNSAFEIITFTDSFHGRTLATMSASGKKGFDSIFPPKVEGFKKATFNDINSVLSLINNNTVGIMLEPIQGESGVIPAEEFFMQQLKELCLKHKILLICDEVQSGCGRSGSLFAHQLYNVEPDIITLGKGIGGGVPLGALVAKEEVCCFEAGDQGGTYNGNPLMTAVGVTVFKQLLSNDFLLTVKQKGTYLSSNLNKISEKYKLNGERGHGLLRALILNGDYAKNIVEQAKKLQPYPILLNAPRDNCLRFMPALNVTISELDLLIESLDKLLHMQLQA